MSDFENLGVNEPGVAEPDIDTGVNEPEVAEPDVETVEEPTEKNTASEAWANMRRATAQAEERARLAEERNAELEAQMRARAEAVKRIGGNEHADVAALAESLGVDTEDVIAILDAEQESAKKDIEIERLREEVNSEKAEKAMQKDLSEIQKINPNIKSLEELGDSFINYIKAGLTATEAYFAVERKDKATKITPPSDIGRVNNEPPEKEFFTEAEVDAMTPKEQKKFFKKIKESMKKW